MKRPISIFKNEEQLYSAANIQEASIFLANHLNINENKLTDSLERGYVYNIPYYSGEDKYTFVAPDDIAARRRKELEESDHKNARRVWLIPANPKEYDLERAFMRYETINWRRSYNYENGDLIFIYVSGSDKKVRYKVEVIEGKVSSADIKYNDVFWQNKEKFEQSKEWDWTCIRLIDEIDTSELSLPQLRDHGLKGNLQGSMRITGELRDYIMSFFKGNLTTSTFPDEVSGAFEEGKRKTVSVNIYERNPIARKKCLEHYGVHCQICKFNFEKVYGEVGRDFIHVHHIKPLHTIQQDYEVDPKMDLIPVCPNCHAMLHRKEGDEYLSIDQLRNRFIHTPV